MSDSYQPSILQSAGYTLLEVLIALGIFLMVLVPMTGFVLRGKRDVEIDQKLTALCILDQEAVHIKAFPGDAPPEKRRQVAGREWVVKVGSAGSGIKQYTVNISLAGKELAMAKFMNYEGIE